MLLLDEPCDAFDIAHQLSLMENLYSGNVLGGIAALHDLGLASRYCSRILVVHEGRLVAGGSPDEALSEAVLASVFDVEMKNKLLNRLSSF